MYQALLKNHDCHIGTHLGTKGTTGAPFRVSDVRGGVAQVIEFFAEKNQFARTGGCANTASFTAQLIDCYFSHSQTFLNFSSNLNSLQHEALHIPENHFNSQRLICII